MRRILWLLLLLAGCGQDAAERQTTPATGYTSGDRATAGPLDTLHVGQTLELRLVPGRKSDFATAAAVPQCAGENACLRAEPAGQVRRYGHTLCLTLQNGRQLQLRDNTHDMRGDDNEVLDTHYEFRGSLPGRPYWLVDSILYEGGILLLVSKRSGRVVARLWEETMISPNRQQLLTYNPAVLEGDIPGVELLSITDTTIKPLWYRKLYQWKVEQAVWLDAHTVAIKRVRFDSAFVDTARHLSYIRLVLPH